MVEEKIISSNSCSVLPTKKYDVFISYRGEDTRRNFTSHLYEALMQKEVETYVDEDIEKGDEISPALMKAIENSRVSIVVFSENFASSKWCLCELVKIMECKKDFAQTVIPVFYNIDPSHVRKQTGSYEESFVKHEGEPNCKKWKAALTEAANLAGWNSQNYRIDPELLKDIVGDVLRKLPPRCRNQCKGRMENLTRKAQLQEVEFERTTKRLKQAIAIGSEETAKCKAAEEVIKTLTAQSFTKTKEFDNIKEIDGKRETLKLGVRINDLWHVNNRNGSKHLEMILMDDKGDLISAVVKKEDLVVWESRLVKNETYVMHNFKILKNQPQYRVCDHDYKLIFIGATIVKVQPLPNIPMKLFNFKSIKQIKDGDFHAGILIDVIGIVHNVKNNPNSTSVVFDMFDLSGFAIGCTLWDSYATKFMDHWDGIDKSKGFVIILTQAKIKPASGPWPVSISNFWHGTKLLMDQDFPQIKEMKELLKQMHANELSLSMDPSQQTLSSQYTKKERFMYKAYVKHVREFSTMKEEACCVTVATTMKFNLGNGGWSFPTCNYCKRRTEEVGSFKCVKCNAFNKKAMDRYKLDIQVCYGNDVANFILWDQECTNIIGKSVVELKRIMMEATEDDPKIFPKDLDVLLGVELAFKVRVQPQRRCASVIKTCDDAEIIRVIKDVLEQNKDGKCIENKIYDLTTKHDTSICNLSGIANNDPNVDTHAPPSKRLLPMFDGENVMFKEL